MTNKESGYKISVLLKALYSIMMAFPIVISVLFLTACGDDDDSVQDSYINDGKKLVELSCSLEDASNSFVRYRLNYDSKGRLTNIISGYSSDNIGEIQEREIARIDYELHVLTCGKKNYIINFNESGYISDLFNTHLTYDSKGYLIGVDATKTYTTLAYESNELTKSSILNMKTDKMQLCYVTYEKDNKEGVLYVRLSSYDKNFIHTDIIEEKDIIGLIAYQCGLLGKVSKTILRLRDKKEAKALFKSESNDKESKYIWCFSLKYE